MEQSRYQEYRSIRARSYSPSASSAFRILNTPAVPPIDWEDGRGGLPYAEWEEAGYQITVKAEYDECPDTSYFGKYVSNWEEGAIKRHNTGRDEYEYFLPECTDLKAEARWFSKLGYDKQSAWVRACQIPLRQFKWMEDLNDGQVSMIGIVATASREGIELGADSLWGIEYGYRDGEEYISEIARQCVGEAIGEADKNLSALCGK